MRLPAAFLARPLAHRGLHDRSAGVIENSLSAFDAAIAAGYGIELDVQISRDGVPVVFHDPTLDRVTGATGQVNARSAADLASIPLIGSDDTILSLDRVLAHVAGRAPVLVEIKDQTGLGSVHALDQAVGQVVRIYGGPVAIMSFNPTYIAALGWLKHVARGFTSTDENDYPDTLPPDTRRSRARLGGFEAAGATFLSHNHRDLQNPRLHALKDTGAHILCWTIRSQDQADAALRVADNITFEGFIPA